MTDIRILDLFHKNGVGPVPAKDFTPRVVKEEAPPKDSSALEPANKPPTSLERRLNDAMTLANSIATQPEQQSEPTQPAESEAEPVTPPVPLDEKKEALVKPETKNGGTGRRVGTPIKQEK